MRAIFPTCVAAQHRVGHVQAKVSMGCAPLCTAEAGVDKRGKEGQARSSDAPSSCWSYETCRPCGARSGTVMILAFLNGPFKARLLTPFGHVDAWLLGQ